MALMLARKRSAAIHIRKATIDDAPTSFAIRREAIHAQCRDHYAWQDLQTWTAGAMSEDFAKRVADRFHVAVINERVVATGMIDLVAKKIDAIFVLPECMGHGIGRAMMKHLEDLAVNAGLRDIYLDATLNAAPFYRALGWVGESTAMYASSLGVSLACVHMAKHLRSDSASALA